MKYLLNSLTITAAAVIFLTAPVTTVHAEDPAGKKSDAAKTDRAALQKALAEAKKDPEVAAAFKTANVLALTKVAETHPELAEGAQKEILKLQNAREDKNAGGKADKAKKAAPDAKGKKEGGKQAEGAKDSAETAPAEGDEP